MLFDLFVYCVYSIQLEQDNQRPALHANVNKSLESQCIKVKAISMRMKTVDTSWQHVYIIIQLTSIDKQNITHETCTLRMMLCTHLQHTLLMFVLFDF